MSDELNDQQSGPLSNRLTGRPSDRPLNRPHGGADDEGPAAPGPAAAQARTGADEESNEDDDQALASQMYILPSPLDQRAGEELGFGDCAAAAAGGGGGREPLFRGLHFLITGVG